MSDLGLDHLLSEYVATRESLFKRAVSISKNTAVKALASFSQKKAKIFSAVGKTANKEFIGDKPEECALRVNMACAGKQLTIYGLQDMWDTREL